MNELFDTQQDDLLNRSYTSQSASSLVSSTAGQLTGPLASRLASRNGIRPVARVSPADAQTSDTHGPGSFNPIRAAFGEQSFAMIAAYSLVILVALGYVPGLGL